MGRSVVLEGIEQLAGALAEGSLGIDTGPLGERDHLVEQLADRLLDLLLLAPLAFDRSLRQLGDALDRRRRAALAGAGGPALELVDQQQGREAPGDALDRRRPGLLAP